MLQANTNWYIPVTIDVTGNDLGGPVVSSPVIKKLGANSGAQTFPLTVTDPDFHEFTCSVGSVVNAGFSSPYMTVSPNCEVTYA